MKAFHKTLIFFSIVFIGYGLTTGFVFKRIILYTLFFLSLALVNCFILAKKKSKISVIIVCLSQLIILVNAILEMRALLSVPTYMLGSNAVKISILCFECPSLYIFIGVVLFVLGVKKLKVQ